MAALPYIQLYPADYLADTAHLNAAQHGAYLLLIMNYWQTGAPLKDSNVRLANVARMSKEEWLETREMLEEFFEIKDGEWIHHRIERDLSGVYSKSKNASAAGKASAEARRIKRLTNVATNVQRNGNHTDTDTDTDTENKDQKHLSPDKPDDHQPKKRKSKDPGDFVKLDQLVREGVNEQHAKDWLAVRKKKRADLTPTAWSAVQREAKKAGISISMAVQISAERGWIGFKSDWDWSSGNGQRTETGRKLSAIEIVAARGAERERARQGAQPQYFEQGDFIEGEFAQG